jgi:hypothetical protein
MFFAFFALDVGMPVVGKNRKNRFLMMALGLSVLRFSGQYVLRGCALGWLTILQDEALGGSPMPGNTQG